MSPASLKTAFLALLTYSVGQAAADGVSCDLDVTSRVDCGSMGESDCIDAGCCWEEHTSDDQGTVPW